MEYVIPSNDAPIIQTAIAPDSRPALNRPPVPHPMDALTQMIKTMIATKPHTQASYRAAYMAVWTSASAAHRELITRWAISPALAL